MAGYLTELGIHHKGETNSFNLTYDLFEPLRTYVDSFVAKGDINDENFKDFYIKLLSSQVRFKNSVVFLDNALHLYIQSMFSVLNNNTIEDATFIEYEL